MEYIYRIILVLGLCFIISSCSAPFQSHASNDESGLKYYLPSSRVEIQLYENTNEQKKEPYFEIMIGATKYIADKTAGQFLNFEPNIFSDDHLCIVRTETGLLTTVRLASSDRSGDILIKLAETATLLTTGIPIPTATKELGLEYITPQDIFYDKKAIARKALPRLLGFLGKEKNLVYSGDIDPYNRSEIVEVQEQLKARLEPKYNEIVYDILIQPLIKKYVEEMFDKKLTELKKENDKLPQAERKSLDELKKNTNELLTVAAKESAINADIKNIYKENINSLDINIALPTFSGESKTPPEKYDGDRIYYRTRINIPISVSAAAGPLDDNDKKNEYPLFTQGVDIIDNNTEEYIEITRAKFIHKVTDLRFSNGVLTGVNIQHPSQGLAVASLPLDMASAILEVPAAFFTAITRSLQSESNVINAKANLIKSMAEYNKTIKQEQSSTTVGSVTAKPALGVQFNSPSTFSSDSVKCLQ